MHCLDILIVGAGPSGMAAALLARRHGLEVMVIDEQPAPGGQIWRSVEAAARRDDILGPSFSEGRPIAEAFRICGALYEPRTQLVQLEPGFRALVIRDQAARFVEARAVIFATGAQERPIPFPGWTLPGVLTVGAAQILLKNAGQIPEGPTVVAGSGPLPLLYLTQLLRAGGKVAAYLDTTPKGQWRSALRHLPRALRASGDLLKGLGWLATLRASKTPIIAGIADIEALGEGRLETVRYGAGRGVSAAINARTLLVHEGVVPSIHPALSLNCAVAWNAAQDCYTPVVDEWGETSQAGLFIVGDGAGIAGAKAALLRGELAALRIADKLNPSRHGATEKQAAHLRAKLDHQLAARPFLDAMYKPRPQIFAPADHTIVCRCEEVTAGQIRAVATIGRPGPNQVKAATRAGMGPCQGRQCGYSVNRILAQAHDLAPSQVGYFNIRAPLKPVTLGELAAVDRTDHQ